MPPSVPTGGGLFSAIDIGGKCVKCFRQGCPGAIPDNRDDVRHCSKLCFDLEVQQNKLSKLALRKERQGSDMTWINDRWDMLDRVAAALNEYRLLVMEQYGSR